MFTSNPFAELAGFVPPVAMQGYIILMVAAVALGTLFDVWHKSSGAFFWRQWKKSQSSAKTRLGAGETASLAVKTLLNEVATAGEFCKVQRRISHLLMMYGFIAYLVATVAMVFRFPTPATPAPAVWPVLWNIGALMVLIGGYWFFFLLRVDVAKEKKSPFRLVRADLFIVSLLASVTFALVWEFVQRSGNRTATWIALGFYLFFSTLLFVSVPWSKFAHMFYKPAAALQKRVEEANGSSNLPRPSAVSHIRN